jgi:hypothetical protein
MMMQVNNFITDLIDKMIAKDGKFLELESGSRARLSVPGSLDAVPGFEIIDQDELVYDLEALGVRGVANKTSLQTCLFRYQPANRRDCVRFELSSYIYGDRLHVTIEVGKKHPNPIEDLLTAMEPQGASLLYLVNGEVPRYETRGGMIQAVEHGPTDISVILAELDMLGLDLSDGRDKAFQYDPGKTPVGSMRFRVNTALDAHTPVIMFRLIPSEIPPLVMP